MEKGNNSVVAGDAAERRSPDVIFVISLSTARLDELRAKPLKTYHGIMSTPHFRRDSRLA
jgi:hypothetical protein